MFVFTFCPLLEGLSSSFWYCQAVFRGDGISDCRCCWRCGVCGDGCGGDDGVLLTMLYYKYTQPFDCQEAG